MSFSVIFLKKSPEFSILLQIFFWILLKKKKNYLWNFSHLDERSAIDWIERKTKFQIFSDFYFSSDGHFSVILMKTSPQFSMITRKIKIREFFYYNIFHVFHFMFFPLHKKNMKKLTNFTNAQSLMKISQLVDGHCTQHLTSTVIFPPFFFTELQAFFF